MRWLWFKISGHVLFLEYSIKYWDQLFSSKHKRFIQFILLIYQNYSEFPISFVKAILTFQLLQKQSKQFKFEEDSKIVFQHSLVMTITASRAKYSGGENLPVPLIPRLQWRQLYFI